jgi:hypothetical protein
MVGGGDMYGAYLVSICQYVRKERRSGRKWNGLGARLLPDHFNQHRSHYCILQWNTLHGHGTRYSLGPQLDPSNLWSAEDVVNAISLSCT